MRSSRIVDLSLRHWLALILVGGPIFGVLGWTVTDELERQNDFCNACHIDGESGESTPLHLGIRRGFDGRPPETLAAAHAMELAPEGRSYSADPGTPFRCIDCHGGAGFFRKAQIKALAAKDTLVWLLGDFEEPSEMHYPLPDGDCTDCHDHFEQKAEDHELPDFHDLAVHHVGPVLSGAESEFEIRCVECHLSHEKGGNVGAYFLHTATIRGRCAQCHSEFGDS